MYNDIVWVSRLYFDKGVFQVPMTRWDKCLVGEVPAPNKYSVSEVATVRLKNLKDRMEDNDFPGGTPYQTYRNAVYFLIEQELELRKEQAGV